MNYGDIVKGYCKFCGYVDFRYMGKKKDYVTAQCLSCGFIQLITSIDEGE